MIPRSSPEHRLMRAIVERRGGAVREALAEGASVDVRGLGGYQPLHVAVANGNAAAARMLLDAGADVNAREGRGLTPLMLSARGSGGSLVPALLAAGADVRATAGDGLTALHLAVADAPMCVPELLEAGADPVAPCGPDAAPPLVRAVACRDHNRGAASVAIHQRLRGHEFQQVDQHLLVAVHIHEVRADARQRRVVAPARDQPQRPAHHAFGERVDVGRHSGREGPHARARRHRERDVPQLVAEPAEQQLVRLVQHEQPGAARRQHATVHHVGRAARRANDNVHAAAADRADVVTDRSRT